MGKKEYFIIGTVSVVLLFGAGFLTGFFIFRGGDTADSSGFDEVESGIADSQSSIGEIGEAAGNQSERIAELEELNSELTKRLADREGKLSEAIGIIELLQSGQSADNDLISDSLAGIEESLILTGRIEERLLRLIRESTDMENGGPD